MGENKSWNAWRKGTKHKSSRKCSKNVECTLFFTGGSGDSTSKLIQVVDWVIFCGCRTELVISLLVVCQSAFCSYRLPHSFLRVPWVPRDIYLVLACGFLHLRAGNSASPQILLVLPTSLSFPSALSLWCTYDYMGHLDGPWGWPLYFKVCNLHYTCKERSFGM